MDIIEPVRLATIKKRASVLAAYCAITDPTERDTAAHAAALGVGNHRFLIMARAWRVRPQAEQIDGATVKVDRVPKIPEAVLTILQEVTQELGPSGIFLRNRRARQEALCGQAYPSTFASRHPLPHHEASICAGTPTRPRWIRCFPVPPTDSGPRRQQDLLALADWSDRTALKAACAPRS